MTVRLPISAVPMTVLEPAKKRQSDLGTLAASDVDTECAACEVSSTRRTFRVWLNKKKCEYCKEEFWKITKTWNSSKMFERTQFSASDRQSPKFGIKGRVLSDEEKKNRRVLTRKRKTRNGDIGFESLEGFLFAFDAERVHKHNNVYHGEPQTTCTEIPVHAH